MPNIHVRDVPPRVHAALKRRAKQSARSLNDVVLEVLEEAAARERDDRAFESEYRRLQEVWGPLFTGDLTPEKIIRQDRESR